MKLGRKVSVDGRDNLFLIKSILRKTSSLQYKYWDSTQWWGDQGQTSMCVGYSWAHWIEDGPVTHDGLAPIVPPETIYKEAQKIDEWAGEDYDGTSVRAGAKYLMDRGVISSYLWTWDINTMIDAVLSKGPVVVGSLWTYDMFFPDESGNIKFGGDVAGGHAYLINGVSKIKDRFRIKNSWGRNWGVDGHAYISIGDMEKLIKEDGEVCLAIENKF